MIDIDNKLMSSIKKSKKNNNMFDIKFDSFKTNFSKRNDNLFKILDPTQKGACFFNQQMWANMKPQQRQVARKNLKDTDGDRVPDMFDCQPKNVMRQDFFRKKQPAPEAYEQTEEYPEMGSPELEERMEDYEEVQELEPYGEVSQISGKQLGAGITAAGVVVPVILPLPLMAGLGAVAAKRVEKVTLERTDEHDRPYIIPRPRVQLRNY